MMNIIVKTPRDVIGYIRNASTVKERSDVVKYVSSNFLSYRTISGEVPLKPNDKNQDIEVIQSVLIGLNFLKEEGLTGILDSDTMNAIKRLGSQFKIVVDVNTPLSKDIIELFLKMEYGQDYTPGMKDIPKEAYTDKHNWPGRQSGFNPFRRSEIENVFGKIQYVPTHGRYIKITNNFVKDNIISVEIPQLAKIANPRSTKVKCHRLIANQLVALWNTWEKVGLLNRVKTYNGLFVQRFMTGTNNTRLSYHSYGIAFDINAGTNGYGVQPPAIGQKGSLRELVPYAMDLGFFWGGHFKGNSDGMHFEICKILNPNIVA